jgi:hypothetical protein
VRQALDQGASVEQVAGDAALRLDEYGGMAARLRYRAGVQSDGGDVLPNVVARAGSG